MKASLKFREDQKPLLRAKVSLSILGLPFQSGIVTGESKELSLNLSTFFESGPSMKIAYRPNDTWNPFWLIVKTGTGSFGSPICSSMLMSAEFNLLEWANPSFMLHFKPQFGDFSIKKSQSSSVLDKPLFKSRNVLQLSKNIMEGNACECWEETSDNEDFIVDQNEEEDYYMSVFISKLQFRKDISKAHWNKEKGMAEIVEKKGKMWTTTGIVRNGNTYCSIEETLFLAEIGALHLLDDNDLCLSLKDIYEKFAGEKTGCHWELFEVYRHLKSLGYIVRRHGVPWTMKITEVKDVDIVGDLGQGTPKRNGVVNMEPKEESSIVDLFNNMQISKLRPDFDVYLPNRKFKKSCPGNPSFVLYLTRDRPPSKGEIEALERQCGGIPLKVCHVDHGRVSFFSFDRMELPVLP